MPNYTDDDSRYWLDGEVLIWERPTDYDDLDEVTIDNLYEAKISNDDDPLDDFDPDDGIDYDDAYDYCEAYQ